MEKELLVEECELEKDRVFSKDTHALVLFSGGFDSVAVALRLINEKVHPRITLLYEDSTALVNELPRVEILYHMLNKIAYQNGIELHLEVERINMNNLSASKLFYLNNSHRDVCLLTHLTTILRHGEFDDIYLGWNRANISDLKYSGPLYQFLINYSLDSQNYFFLEDLFLLKDEHDLDTTTKSQITKMRTVKYLLVNNMFANCTTGDGHNPSEHWYDNSNKWREVVNALIDLNLEPEELTVIFQSNELKTVQDIWNKKVAL